jgi:hypothetical protein
MVKPFHGIVECRVTTVNASAMDLFRMLNTTEFAPLDVENNKSEAGIRRQDENIKTRQTSFV